MGRVPTHTNYPNMLMDESMILKSNWLAVVCTSSGGNFQHMLPPPLLLNNAWSPTGTGKQSILIYIKGLDTWFYKKYDKDASGVLKFCLDGCWRATILTVCLWGAYIILHNLHVSWFKFKFHLLFILHKKTAFNSTGLFPFITDHLRTSSNNFSNTWHVTHETCHVRRDTWYVTWDMWNTGKRGGNIIYILVVNTRSTEQKIIVWPPQKRFGDSEK